MVFDIVCSNGAAMAKKRSWFNLVRKFFVSETECPQDKKDKRRKWVFFGRLKVKSRLASISGPTPSPPGERSTLSEAEEEQSKRALDVALATAAVAAAHAAAEVVLLHSTHQSERQLKAEKEGEEEKQSAMKIQYDREKQAIAAIKIQSTFRGYLARKALRALKGIVKLQAIIRGRNVRRQAMNTLKCLQSIVNIQSQVCAKRIQMAEGTCYCDNNKHSHSSSDKIIKMDTNSLKRWDGSILTKEEVDALFVSKKEAALKRDRIKEYSFNHRNSAETERNKSNGRWKYWLEQWVDTQVSKSKEVEDLDTVMTSSPKPRVEYSYRGKQIKLRNMDEMEGIDSNSPIAAAPPRRSFHRKQNSLGEENSNSLSRSPVIPAYMAATESAKAKAARSLSSPKLRPMAATPYDAFSDSYSPSKNKLSLLTSTATATARYGKQTSPSLKGLPTTPLKSNLTLNHLSFDSQCSFRTWDHHTNFP